MHDINAPDRAGFAFVGFKANNIASARSARSSQDGRENQLSTKEFLCALHRVRRNGLCGKAVSNIRFVGGVLHLDTANSRDDVWARHCQLVVVHRTMVRCTGRAIPRGLGHTAVQLGGIAMRALIRRKFAARTCRRRRPGLR